MNVQVSKSRSRNTRRREKQAIRRIERDISLRDGLIRLAIAALLFAATLALAAHRLSFLGRLADVGAQFAFLGRAVVLLLAYLSAAILLNVMEPKLLRRTSRVTVLASTALLSLALFRLVAYGIDRNAFFAPEVGITLMPLALAGILATMLVGRWAGLVVGIWSSVVAALMFDGNVVALYGGAMASVAVVAVAGRLSTRSRVIRCSMLIGLAQLLGACASLFILRGAETNVVSMFQLGAASVLSAFVSGLLALLLLPAFERLFAITTDISLLEIADMGHPLLRRMAIEAPGTYHHSMVVANLAAAAAQSIGANSLLARVCAYFHDIGKLTKPEFFVENLSFQANPHDDLPPSMSTLVISAHVKEGISLAQIYRLPREVLDVIQEHHGNSLMSVFHQKAKEQIEEDRGAAASGAKLNEQDFRYQGPRPRSRESAIIALADSVEAASRTLEKVTPVTIEHLVGQIVLSKVRDGQLDECGLSFSELSQVRKSFVFSLTSMLHERIKYPKDDDRDSSSQRLGKATQPSEGKSAGRLSDAPSHPA